MGGMRDYPEENWKALGRWVHDQRVRVAAWRDVREWAKAVGRSDRQLRGLERGERVGIGTLDAVARVLDVDVSMLLDILAAREVVGAVDQADYVAAPGEPATVTLTEDELEGIIRRAVEEARRLDRP